MPELTIIRRDGAWWIQGALDGDCGPFEAAWEAEETLDRLERLEEYEGRAEAAIAKNTPG